MVNSINSWWQIPLESEIDAKPIEELTLTIGVMEFETVGFRVSTWSDHPNVAKAALLKFTVRDVNGDILQVGDWPSTSRVGHFRYVRPGSSIAPSVTIVRFRVPKDGVTVEFSGQRWNQKVCTMFTGGVGVHRSDAEDSYPWDNLASFVELPAGAPEVVLRVRLTGIALKESFSAKLHFLGDTGVVLPLATGPFSGEHGPVTEFQALQGARGMYEARFLVPDGASHVRWSLLPPADKAWTIGDAVVSGEPRRRESLDDFIEDLHEGQTLIVIDSTAPPLGSGHITIRPNNLARMYAALGIAVISVGFGRLNGNLKRQSGNIFQASRDDVDLIVSRVADEAVRRTCIYVCSSFASTSAIGRTDLLKMHGWRVLYEIRDNMEEFNRMGLSKWYSSGAEVLQCLKSDAISAVSPALARKAEAIAPGVSAKVIPNAILQEFIDGSADLRHLARLEERRRSGIVGYVGHLTDAWFDWHRFLLAAREFGNTSFELVGPGIPDYITLPSNVYYHGSVRQEVLIDIARRWAVGLIPFIDSPLTLGVDPNKLFEYCAWGLRTVSARMGSIDECPTAASYTSDESLLASLQEALTREWTFQELSAVERFLERSSWESRAQDTLELLGVAP